MMPDTLVLAVDRAGDVPRQTSVSTPIVGWDTVRSLVFEIGVSDPEDAVVNTLLEALRVTQDLREDGVDADVAVVSGDGTGVVGADRAVAAGLDDLLDSRNPDSAVLVLDSAEDEQLVPVVESRVPVDAVDRVVVRQARDLESTYYLLKQFLADEELRETVLVPVGIVLLVFPALMLFTGSLAVAAASITAVVGLFLLYKGLGVDDWVDTLPAEAQDALYSGQVSVVTYVVAAGLALVGVFVGALGVSVNDPPLLVVMAFAHDSVPWLALSALAASAGRLVDEAIRAGEVRSPYLNLPFVVVAVGLVLRGFAAYFLQRADLLAPAHVPGVHVGALTLSPVALTPEQRLAGFVAAGVVVSLVGVQVASTFSGAALNADGDDDIEESPRQQQ